MSFVGDFLGDVVGGITGAKQAGQAGADAARSQAAAAGQGIDESRRQFDALVGLMSPYVTAGSGALETQQGLIGLGGQDLQQQLVGEIESSPLFGSLSQQGESSILQNASATGGLRGGNTQAALAQFRPQMLNQLVESQYNKLAGLSQLGQASAAGQGAAGIQTGTNIANLLGQQGAARAGGQLAQGGVVGQTFGDIMSIGGAASGFF